jgi:hypothetical protein
MPKQALTISGSYFYPVMNRPNSSLDGGQVRITDGIPFPPDSVDGLATIGIDSSDGDLKIRFNDGSIQTLAVNTSGSADVILSGTVYVSGSLQIEEQVWSTGGYTYNPTGTSQAVDWTRGNAQRINLGQATGGFTASFTNAKVGASYVLEVQQHPSTPKDVLFSNVKWSDGVKPVTSAASGSLDIYTFYCGLGSIVYGNFGPNFS